MSETNERRCYRQPEELRVKSAEGKASQVTGMAVPYGELSEDLGGFRERFVPGAFGDSIRSSSDKRADIEHDPTMILGRTSKKTLAFREHENRVDARITLPATTRGKDVAEDVRNGNFDAMSVAFRTVEDRWVTESGAEIREVVRAELTGVTLTSYPAYRQTAGEVALRSLEAHKERSQSVNTVNPGSTTMTTSGTVINLSMEVLTPPEEPEHLPDADALRRRLDVEEALSE